MAKFEHYLLDKEGLKQLLIRIRDRFATQKALADETARAKYEEAVLTNNLNDEVNRATIEEIKLDNKIIDEINRAKLAETTLNVKIIDEINRSKLSEETINNRLTDEINRSSLEDALAKNRLDAIESGTIFDTVMLDDSIKGVQNKVIKSYIDERVKSVYRYKGSVENYSDLPKTGNIVGDVWNVVNECIVGGKYYQAGTNFAWAEDERTKIGFWDALGSTVDLTNYYTKKEVDAKEKVLQTNIDDEVIARTSAVNTLTNNLSAETSERKSDDKALAELLKSETKEREDADTKLADSISKESSRASKAESGLSRDITTEQNRATGAETVLQNNINSLYKKEGEVETGIIITKVSEEASLRAAADSELNTSITAVSNRVTKTESDINIINGDETVEGSIKKAVKGEETRAKSEETTLKNNLDNEIARSTNEDTAAKNRLDAIESGTVFDTSMSDDSIKGVQNKVIKAYVDEKVTAVYRYKGSKETYEKLVAEETATAIVGDVWNVEKPCEPEPGKIYQGGTNFAWTGEKWDALGSSVDLSDYYTKKEVYNKNEIDSKEKALQINIDTVDEKLDKEITDRTTETKAIKSDLKTTMRGLETEVDERTTETNAIKKDLRTIDEKVDKEISDRTTADGKLDKRITDIEDILPTVGKVDNVWLDGIPTLDTSDKIAKIKSENVKVLTEVDDITGITGEINKLYRSKLDKKIYQWNGTIWKGIGDDVKQKAYIVVKDTLPTEGEEDVFVIKSSDHTIHQWVGISEQVPTGWQEIGGKDKELREDFTAHLTDEYAHAALFSKKANSEVLAGHMNNLNNPHGVTKLQIGLGNVDNTADADKPISAATQTALNNKVDLSTYTVEIGLKVNYTDIKDNLDTVDPLVPLSANQGTVLDAKIRTLDTKMQSFGSALLFRGVVPSIAALELITEKNIGDCYQINSQVNSEINDDSHDGEMWAWNGTSWVKIVATATDLSSMLATTAEINKIISDYE